MTTLEFDDLKHAWQTLDRRLELQGAMQLHALHERASRHARARLRPLVLGLWCQALIGGALALAFAAFWVNHRDSPHLVLSGVVLQVYMLALVALGGRELAAIGAIDPAEPVAVNQRRLAELRVWRVRTSPWLGLPWALLSVPLVLCLAMAGEGRDLVIEAPGFVALQATIGAAVLLASLLFIRWSRARPRLRDALERSAGGRSVERARAALAAVQRFEQE